jgi:hypothetical protein
VAISQAIATENNAGSPAVDMVARGEMQQLHIRTKTGEREIGPRFS